MRVPQFGLRLFTVIFTNPEKFLENLFRAAVDAASAGNCVPLHLSRMSHRNVHVIGAGKAAAAMAKTVEENVEGEISGIAVTRYGHGIETDFIEVVEAAHPVPDEAGVLAARRIADLASSLAQDDFVICVISGGASALLSLPHPKITHNQKRDMTQQLLLAGASIQEINCVRKHLSGIKGGRLMDLIYPAKALTLCISDVVGDDPSVIGSGPTVADLSTCTDVLSVIDRYRIKMPSSIRTILQKGELETPKPSNRIFRNSEVKVIAKPQDSLLASAAMAQKAGVETIVLGDAVQGDTNQVARQHADMVRQRCADQDNPLVIISGGETTINVTGSGKGGPNTQYALALALELEDFEGVFAIACDTDGIDGTGMNAGALINPSTLRRAKETNLNPRDYLENNDSYSFFEKLGDLVVTGPTLTNVNDFRAVCYVPDRG